MKVEQACRFRMDSGYGISARSPGFDVYQEKVLGEVFNDTMNPVFSEVGASVLSCTTKGQYAFWARSTLRTDIHSRTTIFTHSYVLPLREYATIMEQMPERVLSVPLASLLSAQTGDGAMETVEFPPRDCEPLNAQILFEKYRLTPERYAILLQGAYEAITGNRTLNLYAEKTSEERDVLVRELTFCIMDGLLPSMKKMVTFSSGPDPRMRINVIQNKIGLSGDALVFGVDDDKYTSIRSKDPLRTQMFRDLGKITREQRVKCLEQIEDCLAGMVNIDNCPSLQLIVVAYLRRCTKLTPDTRIALFRNFGAAAGKTMDTKMVNHLLEELVQEMIASGSMGTRELSLIAEWYLADSSEGFRKIADPLFQNASEDICVALEEAILKRKPISPNARRLLCVLINTVDPCSKKITDELRSTLMNWIVGDDIIELLFFCNTSLSRLSSRQMEKLVSDTLKSTHGKVFSKVQAGIIKTAIEYLSGNKILLSEEDIARLDSHIPDYNDELMITVMKYLFCVRVSQFANVEEAVDLLIRLANTSPKMKVSIEAHLLYVKNAAVMEGYQCRSLLPEKVELSAIPGLCTQYNKFNNPGGPFEQAIYRRWIQGISQHLKKCADDVNRTCAVTVEFMNVTKGMKLSTMMINQTLQTIVKCFWSVLSVEGIVKHDRPVPHEIGVVSERVAHLDTEYRRRLMIICGRIKKNHEETHHLVNLMRDMSHNHPDYPEVKRCLPWLMEKVVIDQQWLPLDLLMLRCYAGNGKYDYERMVEILEETQETVERLNRPMPRCSAEISTLLGRNSELRREMIKKLGSGSNNELALVNVVTDALKNKGPAKNLGSSWSVDFGGSHQSPAASRHVNKQTSSRKDGQSVGQDVGKDKSHIRKGLFGGRGKK